MSEHKHTPAPWHVTHAIGEDDKICFHEIKRSDGFTIASTWGMPPLPEKALAQLEEYAKAAKGIFDDV